MARNKTLLTESELRKFMKLANLGAVGDSRLQEMGYGMDAPGARDDELPEEEDDELAMGDEEMAMDDEEMAMDDEEDALGDMDAPADDMGPDAGGAGMVSVDDFMSALENALEDVLGEPVSTEMDDEPADDMDMGDEMGDDMDSEMEMDIEAGPDDMEVTASEEEEELPGMRDIYENQDELVQEVARRVAARLQAESAKSQMVEELSQKILDRLTAK